MSRLIRMKTMAVMEKERLPGSHGSHRPSEHLRFSLRPRCHSCIIPHPRFSRRLWRIDVYPSRLSKRCSLEGCSPAHPEC